MYTREFDFAVRDPRGVSVAEDGSAARHDLLEPNTRDTLPDGAVLQRGPAGGIAIDVKGTALLDSLTDNTFRMVLVRPDGSTNADGPLDAVQTYDGHVQVRTCYGTGKHPCARRLYLRTPKCNVKSLREGDVPLRNLGALFLLGGGLAGSAFAINMDTHPKYVVLDTAVLGLLGAVAVSGLATLLAPPRRWATAEPRPEDCPEHRESP